MKPIRADGDVISADGRHPENGGGDGAVIVGRNRFIAPFYGRNPALKQRRRFGRATSKRLVNLAKHEAHNEPITPCAVVGPHRLEASIEMAQ
jgi:hypothetical protein